MLVSTTHRRQERGINTKHELVFTVSEAREKLGISRGLIYEAIRRGEIPHLRIGKRIVIPRVALERLLERGSRPDGQG